MMICGLRGQKGWWLALFLVVLLVMAGCADVKPYQPPNHREEGPQGGVFTGPKGQWVIYQSDEPVGDSEKKKKPEGVTDTDQPVSEDQKKN